jgi:hypothetical protein
MIIDFFPSLDSVGGKNKQKIICEEKITAQKNLPPKQNIYIYNKLRQNSYFFSNNQPQ